MELALICNLTYLFYDIFAMVNLQVPQDWYIGSEATVSLDYIVVHWYNNFSYKSSRSRPPIFLRDLIKLSGFYLTKLILYGSLHFISCLTNPIMD